MFVLYSLLIRLYYFLVFFASFFNKKAKSWIAGRKNQLLRIQSKALLWQKNPIVWIHAASYGEFEMSRPIIHAIRKKNEAVRFIISFHSPSGFENIDLAQEYFLKIYLPLDIMSKHKKIIDLFDLRAVIFIKYEFWYNFMRQLQDSKIPYFFTSLHLNANSYILKYFFRPFKNQLIKAHSLYCHNPNSIDILSKNGFSNLSLFGDSRIEQVLKNRDVNEGNVSFNNNDKTIAFGSITEYEIPYVIAFCNQFKNYNYIIATHDVSHEYLKKIGDQLSENSLLYSSYNNISSQEKILLVDTYGDLRYLYRSADLAYIGAGFEKGPHNVLEPLVYGVPICIGPNIKKFPMAQFLEQNELLLKIDSVNYLSKMLELLDGLNKNDFKFKVQKFFIENSTNIDGLVRDLNLTSL